MEIYELHHLSNEVMEAFSKLIPQLTDIAPPTEAEMEDMLQDDSVHIYLARDEGRIVGTLSLIVFRTPSGMHAWIEDVVVDEAARGKGIAEALSRTAIGRARHLGARSVNLTSRPSREAANRLYQRIGFKKRESNLYRYPLE
jgi:ribosomal protein S18 acetylase RimI-like enzyme